MQSPDKAASLVKYIQYIQNNCISQQNSTISSLKFSDLSSNTKIINGLSNLIGQTITEPLEKLSDFIIVNLTNKAICNQQLSCSSIFSDDTRKFMLNMLKKGIILFLK